MKIKVNVEVGEQAKGRYTYGLNDDTVGKVDVEFDIPNNIEPPALGVMIDSMMRVAAAEHKAKEFLLQLAENEAAAERQGAQ